MYLREMGSVELLSREGEIAIAKRIEAGRNTMIAGLCESPLTFQAITIWRDELLSEDILLRDVIDLEATFGRSLDGDGRDGRPGSGRGRHGRRPPPRRVQRRAGAGRRWQPHCAAEEDDDDDEASAMSLAAMEAALKPKVLETLEIIARDYAKLAEMQDLRMTATLSETASYYRHRRGRLSEAAVSEIVLLVNALHLHNNRIEALIDQLYGINRKIMSINSGMVKLADAARINRREFIDEYQGYELDPNLAGPHGRQGGPGLAGADGEKSATRSRNCAPRWRRSASISASTSPNSAAS
jgi:RNA polymerase primary sigma factor